MTKNEEGKKAGHSASNQKQEGRQSGEQQHRSTSKTSNSRKSER